MILLRQMRLCPPEERFDIARIRLEDLQQYASRVYSLPYDLLAFKLVAAIEVSSRSAPIYRIPMIHERCYTSYP